MKTHFPMLFIVFNAAFNTVYRLCPEGRGHGGSVVTLLPPISEARVRFPTGPQVGKLVVACRWSAVYSTKP